jgi:hypothetical protein
MAEINHSAQIEPKITAADLEREYPEVLQGLADHVAAHLEKARKYADKAEQHNIAAGKYLAQAQAVCDDGGFKAFREKFFPNLGQSRAYELLSIAANKKSVEDIRASNRERQARHRAKRASDSVTVTESPDHHHIAEPQEISEVEDQVEAGTAAQEQPPEPEKPRRTHTPNDQPLFDFSAHVLEVLRRVDKHKPERFAKTSIPADDLGRLGKFLTDLAQLKKSRAKPTLVAGAAGNATISPEQSAEAMKAQHMAFEEPDDMAA